MNRAVPIFALGLGTLVFAPVPAHAGNDLAFDSVATAAGVHTFARVPSERLGQWTEAWEASLAVPVLISDVGGLPAHPFGLPGVVLLDYDLDDDLDIFVTNGHGGSNALFQNQLVETGDLTFVDRADEAAIAIPHMDSAGACFGDIDNDGDDDLFVVAATGTHRVLENLADGTFDDITDAAGLQATSQSGTSCAMGDVDQDGLLDIVVTHTRDQTQLHGCLEPGFDDHRPNELYLNMGDNTFTEASDASGIIDLGQLPAGAQGASWSTAMVDYDLDGDLDLFTADDQCWLSPQAYGGEDRGFVQVWDNDGEGFFTARAGDLGTNVPGAWMGLAFADFDCDGAMDFFATNFGDWFRGQLGVVGPPVGYGASTWFFGGAGDGFQVIGAGSLLTTPTAWGTTAEDFDNDGDTDIAALGAVNLFINKEASNRGTIFVNDGSGGFTAAPGVLGLDYGRRADHGVAAGDLDNDGRIDLVSVSSHDLPSDMDPVPYQHIGIETGSPFDDDAAFFPIMQKAVGGEYVWTGVTPLPGSVAIALNTTETPHGSVSVEAVGTVDLLAESVVNRSGFGAIVSLTPAGGAKAMRPVTGGSSHLSQNARAVHFGLGTADRGVVEVLWPGGVRNRVYGVYSGETIAVPEIPCSYDDPSLSRRAYVRCVVRSVRGLADAGVIEPGPDALRLLVSAIWARLQG